MSTTDYATGIELPDFEADPHIEDGRLALDGESKPLKGLYFAFAFVVTAGLALTSWYVGVRIVSAEEITAAASISAPAATGFYLQAASLGPKQDPAFVKSLEALGFRALAQTRGVGAARIVIGPFSSHAALELAQRKLHASGVFAVEAAR
jgi:hypothetical protein